MNISLRIWVIVSAVVVVAIVAGGWFAGVQPQIAAAAATGLNATSVETQNRATRLKLAALTKAAARLDTMQAQNAVLQKAVPSVLKPNTFIRRVNELAALDGVDVKSISLGDAVPYTAPASAAGPAPAAPASEGAAPADATAADTAAAAAAVQAPAPALAKTDPMISGANFTVVPVGVTVQGGADAVLQFTRDIQNDERVFAVSGLQITKDDKSSEVTAGLTGFIFTLKR
jgi:Tfp pilus assembly protein PilO